MKKKALSIALALTMCLGLALPALAAEPTTYENENVRITNVIDRKDLDTDYSHLSFGGIMTRQCTCIAPVTITPGAKFGEDITWYIAIYPEDLPEDGDVSDLDWDTYEGYTGKSLTLTEPGSYSVGFASNSTEDTCNFGIEVQAGIEIAPPVPVTDPTTTTPQTAMPTNDKLTVNGALQNPTVYKIDGNNYFKIRDLAAVLNGTEKQFDVGYDGALKSVTATTGKGYAKQAGDLAGAATGGSQTAAPSNDTIYIDGQKTDAVVYKINGNNYFKLRDLGKALDFYVGWTKEGGVFIDTSKPYSE